MATPKPKTRVYLDHLLPREPLLYKSIAEAGESQPTPFPSLRLYSLANETDSFKTCIEPLPDSIRDQKGDHELVLRFFALKNAQSIFEGSVRDWLDEYMSRVMFEKTSFDYDLEKATFGKLFDFLDAKFGPRAFVKYRADRQPLGGLAPAYFEAVTMGLFPLVDQLRDQDSEKLVETLADCVSSSAFRDVTGPAANTKAKLRRRIELVTEAFERLT